MIELFITAWLGAKMVGLMPSHPTFPYFEACEARGKVVAKDFAGRAQNHGLTFKWHCPKTVVRKV